MTQDEILLQLNAQRPPCLRALNSQVHSFEPEQQQLTMLFEPGLDCCHSINIVQGGYVTAMLDAAMAHVVLALEQFHVTVSSIDINVSFLRPTRAGKYRAVGSVVKLGKTIAYLRAELYSDKGELTATATSSAHLSRHHRA